LNRYSYIISLISDGILMSAEKDSISAMAKAIRICEARENADLFW